MVSPAPGRRFQRKRRPLPPGATIPFGPCDGREADVNLERAANILDRIERSPSAGPRCRTWRDAAVRYAGIRVAWELTDAAGRAAMDASRSSAHDVFIDECNILSRAMLAAGESNAWRAEIGTERGEIGDFACLLHCVLGLRAR
jgi:hypothetical protein